MELIDARQHWKAGQRVEVRAGKSPWQLLVPTEVARRHENRSAAKAVCHRPQYRDGSSSRIWVFSPRRRCEKKGGHAVKRPQGQREDGSIPFRHKLKLGASPALTRTSRGRRDCRLARVWKMGRGLECVSQTRAHGRQEPPSSQFYHYSRGHIESCGRLLTLWRAAVRICLRVERRNRRPKRSPEVRVGASRFKQPAFVLEAAACGFLVLPVLPVLNDRRETTCRHRTAGISQSKQRTHALSVPDQPVEKHFWNHDRRKGSGPDRAIVSNFHYPDEQ